MESLCICKIELRGIVGTASVTVVGDKKTINFSLATEYAYRDNDGNAIIETNWFNCRAWDGTDIADFTNLHRGDKVHLIGRLRCRRYQSADGGTNNMYEVIVNSLEIL